MYTKFQNLKLGHKNICKKSRICSLTALLKQWKLLNIAIIIAVTYSSIEFSAIY